MRSMLNNWNNLQNNQECFNYKRQNQMFSCNIKHLLDDTSIEFWYKMWHWLNIVLWDLHGTQKHCKEKHSNAIVRNKRE